jgi:glycosyltransferase involved in cell wall biosynthesis
MAPRIRPGVAQQRINLSFWGLVAGFAFHLVMADRRVLILSLYYPPDLSAGSFRTAALVDALRRHSPELSIDVVTTLPNRYHSFSSEAPVEERDDQLSITRIKLPPHRSGMVDQARAFGHFARAAARRVKGHKYDLVYATSSRLMTAALGAWIAGRRRAPLYLDIRDIFVDTLKEIVPGPVALTLHPVFSAIERWTITRATHVNLVSKGFESYFAGRYPAQVFSYFTNGIDEQFLRLPPDGHRDAGEPLVILCAGNMGQGQGLDAIVPAVAKRLGSRVRFRLVGDGGRRAQLERALAHSSVTNVEVVAPMSRSALIHEYGAADVLFLHLNDYQAFKRVLPSKIFEYAALGKPIWAGVAGHAAEFLTAEVSNASVFPPCDVEQALMAFERLDLHSQPREAFVRKYRRTEIMRAMAAEVLGLARLIVPAVMLSFLPPHATGSDSSEPRPAASVRGVTSAGESAREARLFSPDSATGRGAAGRPRSVADRRRRVASARRPT